MDLALALVDSVWQAPGAPHQPLLKKSAINWGDYMVNTISTLTRVDRGYQLR